MTDPLAPITPAPAPDYGGWEAANSLAQPSTYVPFQPLPYLQPLDSQQPTPQSVQRATSPFRFNFAPGPGNTFLDQQPTNAQGLPFAPESGLAGAAALAGLQPGTEGRGGFIKGPLGIPIATAPISATNLATYGREGLLALLTSAMGLDYQQPEDGSQPRALDPFTRAMQTFGDTIQEPINRFNLTRDNADAFTRGLEVRNLITTGSASGQGFLNMNTGPFHAGYIDLVTSALSGHTEKFTRDKLLEAAKARGIPDEIGAYSTYYDLAPEIVIAIKENPDMTDEELRKLTDGQPLSLNPLVSIGGEIAGTVASLYLAGRALRPVAAAVAPALAGTRAAQLASLGAKAYAINSVSGWTIRGFEWGIKEVAGLTGNMGVAEAMDRLLWQMPLSMNPGLNLIDAVTSRPMQAIGTSFFGRRTGHGLLAGEVIVGRPGGLSDVGTVKLRDLSLRDSETGGVKVLGGDTVASREAPTPESRATGRFDENGDMIWNVGGKPLAVNLGPETRFRDFWDSYVEPATDLDALQPLFQRAGWERQRVELAFGEGNKFGLTLDDTKNALVYIAMQVARDNKGPMARLIGANLPTHALRTEFFIRTNAREGLNILRDNVEGRSDSMVKAFREQFWQLDKLNDTRIGDVKRQLSDTYDPITSLADFAAWIRASKMANEGIAARLLRSDTVPVYRRDVNEAYVAHFRDNILSQFEPHAVVPRETLKQLKNYGGAIELFGSGDRLVYRRFKDLTRTQVENILDSVTRDFHERQADYAATNASRDPQTLYGDGVAGPGVDVLADARVTGISPTAATLIREMEALPPEQRAATMPHDLLERVAEDTGTLVHELAADPMKWQKAIDWYAAKLKKVEAESQTYRTFKTASETFTIRAQEGRMDADLAAEAQRGLDQAMYELANPVDATLIEGSARERWVAAHDNAEAFAAKLQNHLDDPVGKLRLVEVRESADAGARTAYAAKIEAVRNGGDRNPVDPVTGETIPALSTDHFIREMERRMNASTRVSHAYVLPHGYSADALVQLERAAEDAASGPARPVPPVAEAPKAGPVSVSRGHPLIKKALKLAFPDYKGRKITVEPYSGPKRFTQYWDGGTKDDLVLIRVKDAATADVEAIGHPALNRQAFEPFDQPPGTILVVHSRFQGHDMGVRLYVREAEQPTLASGAAAEARQITAGVEPGVIEGEFRDVTPVAAINAADAAKLADPTVHPLTKVEELKRASAEEPALDAFPNADQIVRSMLTDAGTADLAGATAKAISYAEESANLAGEAAAVGQAYNAVFGHWSEATRNFMERGSGWSGANQMDWSELDLNPGPALDARALAAAEKLPPGAARDQAIAGIDLTLHDTARSLSPEAQSIWQRYMGTLHPANMDEAYNAVFSIDAGMTAGVAPADLAALHKSLLQLMHDRLTAEGGAQPTGLPRDLAQVRNDPTVYPSELRDLAAELQDRIVTADDPLAGWETTKYEFGSLPTHGPDGAPLPPRLQLRDFTTEWRRLNDIVPSLGDEFMVGRSKPLSARIADTRLVHGLLGEHAVGNALRELHGHTIGGVTESQMHRDSQANFATLLGATTPDHVRFLRELEDYWRTKMIEMHIPGTALPIVRRVGLVDTHSLNRWAKEYTEQALGGDIRKPEWEWWIDNLRDGNIAETWRKADNRIRNAYMKTADTVGEKLDKILPSLARIDSRVADLLRDPYASGPARTVAGAGRGVTIFYHTLRFLLDPRFLALEYVESPFLFFSQHGLEGMKHNIRGGKSEVKPLSLGDPENALTNYYLWMATGEPGLLVGARRRTVMNAAAKGQMRDFVDEIKRVAKEHPDLAQAIKRNGDTPESYLRRLDANVAMEASRAKYVGPERAAELYEPYRRVFGSDAEFDAAVQSGIYIEHPAIDAAIAKTSSATEQLLLERLHVVNAQVWDDVTRLYFGQPDRSNLQRLLNHPLLFWPISYQIKATKWLASVLTERALGRDTGLGGLYAYGRLMDAHRQALQDDPSYAQFFKDNKELMFFAGMFLPIVPDDIGVSLSPFTRLWLDSDYSRNLFGFGIGYTFFQAAPRLIREQSQPYSLTQRSNVPLIPGAVSGIGQRMFPQTFPVKPTTSQVYAQPDPGAQIAPEPPPPVTKFDQ